MSAAEILDEVVTYPNELAVPTEGTAPSPFLPGTAIQFAVDSTSIGLMKECPRKWWLIIHEGWSSRHESVHLRFGGEYHTCLQEYDVARANGLDHEAALHDVIASLHARTWNWEPIGSEKALRYKNKITLRQLVIDYLDKFVDDPATTYIRTDGKPAVELTFRFELDWGPAPVHLSSPGDSTYAWQQGDQPYLLCGHLDRVINFNGDLMVMDRKTTVTTINDDYFAQFEPNNQMSLYTLAGKVVLDAPIRGVIIDAAQVLLDKPNYFTRGFTYRTPSQLDEWLASLRVLLAQFEHYAALDYWPMNDTACGNYGGCPFRGICSKDPAIRERFLAADFRKLPESERWNPLKPR